MVYRKFNAPNVEYNEIDRSQYGLINDGAAVGTMTFFAGFADKGDDYDAKYSRSLQDFVNTYGYPTNEAERYFFNAAREVFSQGGRAITVKIPYDNDSKDKLAYTVYRSPGVLKTDIPEELSSIDDSITSYFELESVDKDDLSSYVANIFGSYAADRTGLMTYEQYDSLLVGNSKPVSGSFFIVDIARNKYSKDPNLIDLEDNQTQNYLGYLPVVVAPLEAMRYQQMLSGNKEDFSIVSSFQTIYNAGTISSIHVHLWGNPEYFWSSDNAQCSGEATCVLCASHRIREVTETTYETIVPPTTETSGVGRYTADFTKYPFTTQTKDVDIEPLPPIPPTPEYSKFYFSDGTVEERDIETVSADSFYGNEDLIAVELASKVTTIESNAFINCTNLTSIALNTGLKDIEEAAFYGCENLLNVQFPSSLETIGESAFYNSGIREPILAFTQLNELGGSVFRNCANLESIDFPATLTSIGANVFYGCESLAEVDFFGRISDIGIDTFRVCNSLKEVYFEDQTMDEIENLAGSDIYNYFVTKLHWAKFSDSSFGARIICTDGYIDIDGHHSENSFGSKKRASSKRDGIVTENQIVVYKRANEIDVDKIIAENLAIPLNSDSVETESLSKIAASFFPSIKFQTENRLDRIYLKQIGIVVFKMFSDPSNYNKIDFTPVEAFVGSLDRKAKDPVSGKNIFIDEIVNNQSQTINVFSNFDFRQYSESLPVGYNETVSTIESTVFDKASTIAISDQVATSLGFFLSQCSKFISEEVIEQSLDMSLENCKDPLKVPIDIVADAGVSNIAQYIASNETVFYDPEFSNEESYVMGPTTVSTWKKILKKFDDFARYVRKDCIFVADGPRHLCLAGNQKIVRKSAPRNTIAKNLIPKIRYMSGINSSYSAGYCNWFRCIDSTSQNYFWCPPSIKAVGVYLYTDRYANTWDAPAGDNRGVIQDAYDVAFNPTVEEAQSFYEQQWNYAISYPLGGIVLEGQKTFQIDKTALDRINVRRLCLAIKKGVKEIARWFKYEKITDYEMARFRDQLNEFLQKVQLNQGISEYYLKLDHENNTDETIERNELHVAIAIRPIKTAEFIIINSIVVNQSANLEEVVQSVLA